MQSQESWLRGQIAIEAPNGQPYWVGMQHVMQQFDGLVAGYTQFADEGEELSPLYLYMLEAMGDLEDLDNVFPSTSTDNDVRNRDANLPNKLKDTDCSGFIKILPDASDIVVGHSTWRDFYAMIRVYKVCARPLTRHACALGDDPAHTATVPDLPPQLCPRRHRLHVLQPGLPPLQGRLCTFFAPPAVLPHRLTTSAVVRAVRHAHHHRH